MTARAACFWPAQFCATASVSAPVDAAGRRRRGVAWKAKSKGDEPKDYLSVQLDDPSFPEPIRAALFEEDGAAFLVWNRKRDDAA